VSFLGNTVGNSEGHKPIRPFVEGYMAGHIYQRGSTWSFIIDLPKQPVTDKRRQKQVGGFATEVEAAEAMLLAQADLVRGTYVEPTRRTFATFLDEEWLPAKRLSVTENSWCSYRDTVERYLVPTLGKRRLTQLGPQEFQRAYAELLDHGGKGGRSLSPSTVRYVHTVARMALRDAVTWGLLAANPVDRAKPPALPRKTAAEMRWSRDHLETFLAHTHGTRLHPLWHLLAWTGARRGEALGLHWSDVDLVDGSLVIRRSLSTTGGRAAEPRAPKTGSSERSVSLDPTTVAEERLLMETDYEPTEYVFTRLGGRPLSPPSVSSAFGKARPLELPKLPLHGLRHTHATLLLEDGVNPKVVQERLGHSDVAITLRTYSHKTPILHREAVERLAVHRRR
jgi:integrase